MNKRENIYSLEGFGKVFRFTMRQTFKNKGYLVSFVMFVLMMTLMGPIQCLSQRAGQGAAKDSIDFNPSQVEVENIYIYNETAVMIDKADLEELYKGNEDDEASEEAESGKGITEDKIIICELLEGINTDEATMMEQLTDKDMLVFISMDEKGYYVNGVVSKDSKVKVDDLDDVTEIVKNTFDEKRLESSDVSEEDAKMIFSGVNTNGVISENDYKSEASQTVSRERYMFYMLGYSMIIFIVISMSTSYIITSVTEEKQSKLVETLLVSVRPMALLIGKICGMMSYVVLLLTCGVIGSNISNLVMKNVFHISEAEFSNKGFNFSIFKDFGVVGGIALAISILFAFFAFGMISGLFGSTCNKTEDIQNATGNVMTFSMVSYFAAIGMGCMDIDAVNMVGAIIPPFSFFTAPVAYVTGRIGIAVLLAAYAIQIVAIIFIIRLSAKSYRNLLLSDSTTQKLSAIFKSAKG